MTTTTAANGKKVPWTQTEAGKKKLSKMMKDRHKAGLFKKVRKQMALAKKAKESANGAGSEEEFLVGFAVGHIKSWLAIYAESHSLSGPALANRVGKALQAASRR